MTRHLTAALVVALSIATQLKAQEKAQAFVGAHLITVAGPEIDNGTLLVKEGKIIGIGGAGAVPIPDGAERHDVRGKIIMPGLIDTHSHIGGPSGGDGSAPLQPEARVIDAINVRDAGLQKAQAGGITTVNIMPGSGHLLSGQTIYLKLRDGNTIDDLFIKNADGSIAGGMKMANGTNSIRSAPFPGTRAKSAALDREQFVRAQEYRDKLKAAGDDPDKKPDRDLGLEALVEVLDGKRIVHFHTHRHDDILTVLRLQKEFGFRLVLHHVTEGWKVPSEIASAKVPCSIIVIDSPGGKPETEDLSFANATILDQAGVTIAFHTDDGITDSRLFLRSPALAMRYGLPREKALAAMTINGAKMLDLADRTGSLELGKDADFIVLSGDPFSVYTHVMQTYVEGLKVFDRDDPKDHLFAVGGYGASKDQVMHTDCFHDGDGQ
ncbi:MAG TPA: amidohydrolase family protein [Tepidisphaeraceae bacterium]|jgi:imidazolonepropionase-like amidohydrolase